MYLFVSLVPLVIFIATKLMWVEGADDFSPERFNVTFTYLNGLWLFAFVSMFASARSIVNKTINGNILLALNIIFLSWLLGKAFIPRIDILSDIHEFSSYISYLLWTVFFYASILDFKGKEIPLQKLGHYLKPWIVMTIFIMFSIYFRIYILFVMAFVYLLFVFKITQSRGGVAKSAIWFIAMAIPITLFLYLLGFMNYGVMNQYSSIPHGYYKSEAELKGHVLDGTAEVSGRYFKIPKKYLSLGDINYAQKIHKLSLRLNWSDFKPRGYDLDKKKIIKTSNGNTVKEYLTLTGSIVVEEPKEDGDLFNRLFESKGRNVPLTPMKIEEIPQRLEGYIFHGNNPNNLIDHSNIYIIKDGDLITDLIICGIKNRNNSCNHRFHDKGLNYNIRYNKDRYFSKWEEMQKSAINFVESFEVFPNFEGNEKGKVNDKKNF